MMWMLVEVVAALAVALVVPAYMIGNLESLRSVVRYLGFGGVALAIVGTSFIYIGPDEVGLMHRIYFGGDMPQGQIIARKGERGPQADVIPPGFKFSFMINILNDITKEKVITVPDNKVGILLAKDGAPLRAGQAFADPLHMFSEKGAVPKSVDVGRMISDASYFLNNDGQKGPQTTTLMPGKHRLNLYLWEVTLADAIDIPKGAVAVIKSNVYGAVDQGSVMKVERPDNCDATHHGDPKKLAAPLVPVGCVGIWSRSLPPGRYYFNPNAYQVTQVDTRQQAWLYRGGYTKRDIALTVDREGKIDQRETTAQVPVPKDAAEAAIDIKVEGWTMYQGVRALVQVTPENAPFVVASVGGITEVEDRVVTPALQSLLRNIAGGFVEVPGPDGKLQRRATHALDFIENREYVEKMLEPVIIHEAAKAGILMQEVRLLETDFPPELLVARKRVQLAEQLMRAYAQEQSAQTARIKVKEQEATADQQGTLVAAQIKRLAEGENAEAEKLIGTGRRDRLALEAVGQRAQADVLGTDKVMQLQIIGQVITFFRDNPKILELALTNANKFVPNTVVSTGGNGGFDLTTAAAAVMGMTGSPPAVPALGAPAAVPAKK